jgi:hypothetical protein
MNPDDPKFTAHALGETEDLTPAERAEIEALLASDPVATAEADELRSLAARLRAELPGEEAGALQADQRAAIMSAATATVPEEKIVRFPWRRVLQAAAAVAVLAAIGGLMFPALSLREERARLAEEQLLVAKLADPQEGREMRRQDLGGLMASNPEPAPALPAPSVAMPVPSATPLPATPGPMDLASITATHSKTPTFDAPVVSDPRGVTETWKMAESPGGQRSRPGQRPA